LVGLLAVFGAVCLVVVVRTVPVLTAFRPHAPKLAPPTGVTSPPASTSTLQQRYLDLLRRYLTRYDFDEVRPFHSPLDRYLAPRQLSLVEVVPMERAVLERDEGHGWPSRAETMIGLRRLENVEFCVRDVLEHHVPGDLLEAGAWRGGATIYMRAVLEAYGDTERSVWVADSFEGLPKPDTKAFPQDAGLDSALWSDPQLAVSLEEVKANFTRYGLLDERVRFLKGWFKDTLPGPVERLAVLRVDADLYESTTEALEALYAKVSPGGWIIDDDYALPTARRAVDDFRTHHGITAPLKRIDWTGVYWQKAADEVKPTTQAAPARR
jgi:O-methyltransferase